MRGWGSPDPPVEVRPLLVETPASLIVEAGSPQALAMGSSRGLSCLKAWRAAALTLLRKIGFSKYCAEKNRFLLAERRSRNGIRRIVFSRRIDGNRGEQVFNSDEHVFASFLMPLQVLILLGLVVRLFCGDILLTLSLLIASRLAG